MRSRIALLFTLFLFCNLTLCAFASSVPTLVSYQGKLTGAGGQPVADGPYSVTFKLYAVQTGGTSLWSESTSVQTTGGVFSVLLGSVTPIDPSVFGGDSWLETVVGGVTLTPRTRIVSVPYAFRAVSADNVAGMITGTQIPDGAITSGKLAPGVLNGVDATGVLNADPTYQHVLTVAKSGAKYGTITAAMDAISDNSSSNTYLVQVMPGTYTESVGMKPFVTIKGASRASAKIVGNITAANNAAMEQLTITAGTADSCLLVQNASPRFTD